MYQNILFDLDGTLTDPGTGITNSVMYALKKFGIDVADRTSLYKFIGPPLKGSFQEFFGFSDEQGDLAVRNYREYFRETVARIASTRDRFIPRLRELGFQVQDSAANFVFVSHRSIPGKVIFEQLKARNIYVRWWDKARISDYLRITIGTDEQMEILLQALRDICSGNT